MQQTPETSLQQVRRCDPVPGNRIAATALSLPRFSAQIPGTVLFRSGETGLGKFADLLAQADVMQPQHFKRTARILSDACELALSEFCRKAQPNPSYGLRLYFTDDCEKTLNFEFHEGRHREPGKSDWSGPISALCLFISQDTGPVHKVIGPILQALENAMPRLGQTVIDALDSGFEWGCRACTPRSAYGWAQYIYWGGEEDETMRIEEELPEAQDWWDSNHKDGKPKNKDDKRPTADDIQIFRRRDYDKAIPKWAGSGSNRPLSLETLKRLHRQRPPKLRRFQNVIYETIVLKDYLRHTTKDSRRPDICDFSNLHWEMVPYLIRWSNSDPIAQIWDDVLNNEYEAGEVHMDVNAVFTFRDLRTLRSALNRLRRYLEVTQLSENLLRYLPSK